MDILTIAGARPNFMKIASLADAIHKHNMQCPKNNFIGHRIIHTGQHYDARMSQSFFDDLGIPKPDFNLEVGSGSHAQQTAEIMRRFEPILLKEKPDFLIVVGDVNSTVACALVASKIAYPDGHHLDRPIIVHVEAGLRSFDRNMPEEINRILTDALSDMLFVTEKQAIINLKDEGISAEKTFFVGNVMIDTLKKHLNLAKKSKIKSKLSITNAYGLITLHRPSNVDNPSVLKGLIQSFKQISTKLPLFFPLHPRTSNSLKKIGELDSLRCKEISLIEPLGYLDFLNLLMDSTLVLTDSGGVQEETTYLGVPCLTLRENTERPITIAEGSNYLLGTNTDKIVETVDFILAGQGKRPKRPELWDGKAGQRIVQQLVNSWEQRPVS